MVNGFLEVLDFIDYLDFIEILEPISSSRTRHALSLLNT